MKKFLSLLLVFALIITAAGVIPASALESADLAQSGGGGNVFVCGDYEYGLDEDGCAHIYSYNGSDTQISVPSDLDGHRVIELSWGCFQKKNITSVTIPDTVLIIDSDAFRNCASLETVVIPNSVYRIWNDVFSGCELLMDLDIPDSVVEIGKNAFNNTAWYTTKPNGMVYAGKAAYKYKGTVPETVTLQPGTTALASGIFEGSNDLRRVQNTDSLQVIGYDAFKYCKNLESFDFPDGLTKIDTSAFEQCDTIESVSLPASLKELGERVFHYCDSLTALTVDSQNPTFDSRGGCNAIIETATSTLLMAISTSTIPNGVEVIGNDAFMSNQTLTELILPESLRVIGDQAFWDCDSLASVKFPSHLEKIGSRAFAYCDHLEEVSLPDTVTSLSGNAFESCAWYKNLPSGMIYFGAIAYGYKYDGYENAPEELAFREGTKYIADEGFHSFPRVTTVSFPSTLIDIGYAAFNNCDDLAAVTVPEGVVHIGDGAFADCDDLKSASLPSTVTDLEWSTFSDDQSLKFVTLAEGLKAIPSYMFYGCKSLETIEIPSTVTEIGWGAFYNCEALQNISIPDAVAKIEGMAFSGNKALKTVYLGTGLVEVNASAFNECDITYLFIKDISTFWNAPYKMADLKIKYIYLNNKLLTELTVPESITAIRESAFVNKNSSNWKVISLSEGVTSIGSSSFEGCEKLTTVLLPSTLITIGESAFENCDSLTDVVIPDSVTTIGDSAFDSCDSLKSFTIGASATDFSANILTGCNKLMTLKVSKKNPIYDSRGNSNAVIETATGTLYLGCAGSYIPETVKVIGDSAFERCGGLTEIRIPSSVTSIGDSAFYSSGLTKIVIPETVTSLGSHAFNLCSNLKDYAIGNPDLNLINSRIGRYYYWESKWDYQNNRLVVSLREGKYDGVTLYGYEGSTAKSYASSNGFSFKPWSERPSEPPRIITALLGDVDSDDTVTVIDVTYIQKKLASLPIPFEMDETVADTDEDGAVTIVDATYIQKWLASLKSNDKIGKPIG